MEDSAGVSDAVRARTGKNAGRSAGKNRQEQAKTGKSADKQARAVGQSSPATAVPCVVDTIKVRR